MMVPYEKKVAKMFTCTMRSLGTCTVELAKSKEMYKKRKMRYLIRNVYCDWFENLKEMVWENTFSRFRIDMPIVKLTVRNSTSLNRFMYVYKPGTNRYSFAERTFGQIDIITNTKNDERILEKDFDGMYLLEKDDLPWMEKYPSCFIQAKNLEHIKEEEVPDVEEFWIRQLTHMYSHMVTEHFYVEWFKRKKMLPKEIIEHLSSLGKTRSLDRISFVYEICTHRNFIHKLWVNEYEPKVFFARHGPLFQTLNYWATRKAITLYRNGKLDSRNSP